MLHGKLCFRSTTVKWPSSRYLLNALLCVFLLQFIWVGAASASEGDEVPLFHACVNRCMHSGCVQASVLKGTCKTACPRKHHTVPFWLWLLGWSCEGDCHYHCMMTIEEGRAAGAVSLGSTSSSMGHVKYNSSWPLVRLLGMQHFFSAILSLASALLHTVCLFRMLIQPHDLKAWASQVVLSLGPQLTGDGKRSALSKLKAWGVDLGCLPISTTGPTGPRQDEYPYTWIWIAHALLHGHAAYWGFYFHANNTWHSELMDNCASTSLLFFGLLAVVMRAGCVRNPVLLFGSAIVVCQLFFMYIYSMAEGGFGGSTNRQLAFALMVAQVALWVIWSQRVRHPQSLAMSGYALLMLGVHVLGWGDPPPVFRLLDVHVLGHAVTLPATLMFYRFVASDMRRSARRRLW